MKTVVMLHAAKHAHVPEYLATLLMQCLAGAVWGDSKSALSRVLPFKRSRTRVISFVTRRIDPSLKAPLLAPNFLYWGRLAEVKNLPEVIRFFAEIHSTYPKARLTLIGPDDGMRTALQEQIATMNLTDAVHFGGQQTWDQIAAASQNHSFYLQLSKIEGMAMSVVEAMQMGLVPIVTPVGEIASYCHHMENGVLYSDMKTTKAEVDLLLRDPKKYRTLSSNAIASWQNVKTYPEDFLDACETQSGLGH